MTKLSCCFRSFIKNMPLLLIVGVLFELSQVLVLGQSVPSTFLSRVFTNRTGSLSVSFTYTPAYPVEGQAVKFVATSSGSPTSWLWDFGEGSASAEQNPVHIFGKPGFHKVTLTASNGPVSKTTLRTITIMPAPATATFVFSPVSPKAGQTAMFADTSSGDPTHWLWDFGDGATSTAKNPTHVFAKAATYTVTLISSNSSSSKRGSQAVTVTSASDLTASFAYSPASPVAGQSVQFTDTSTGNPTSWQWNFNDGTTSTAQNPSHAFSAAGSYTITLTVSNSYGSSTATRIINIAPESTLIASFTHSPTSPATGQVVQFTDTSTGNPTSWHWNFGDGTTSTLQNPTHIYTSAGSYSLTLTISAGSNSASSSITLYVEYAHVIVAASPSLSDVKAAISQANPGDTIIVPSGSATWDSNLVITKGIYIIGAGIGKTVIKSNWSSTNAHPRTFFIDYNPATPANNEPFRFSGFTLDMDNRGNLIGLRNSTTTPITKIRVDHNELLNCDCPIMILGTVYGVADNNVMTGSGWVSVRGVDTAAWQYLPFEFGTADNFYFEDNVITTSGWMAAVSGAGSRYCMRYNSITSTYRGAFMGFDMHGNQGNIGEGGYRSAMGGEFYENTLTSSGNHMINLNDHRGGKALVYNNNAVTTGTTQTQVREEYHDNTKPPHTHPISGQPQHVSETYTWGNRRNGTTIINTIRRGTVDYSDPNVNGYLSELAWKGIVPQKDREFWDEDPAFNGTSGIGVGLSANRPATGVPGVGYWATDTKKLYRWTSNNRWEEYYAPYTYPHPLRDK